MFSKGKIATLGGRLGTRRGTEEMGYKDEEAGETATSGGL
jgi:hypothetical protein